MRKTFWINKYRLLLVFFCYNRIFGSISCSGHISKSYGPRRKLKKVFKWKIISKSNFGYFITVIVVLACKIVMFWFKKKFQELYFLNGSDGFGSEMVDLGWVDVLLLGLGQQSLIWVWVWKISPKNTKFFNFSLRVKKSLWVRSKVGQPLHYCGSKVCSDWVRAHLYLMLMASGRWS